MARGTKAARRMDARERARAARLRIDQERERRDRAIEEAAADYFTAEDARVELLRQLHVIETTMASAVERLRDLGESTSRITGLLDLDAKEVRRLLALSTSTEQPDHPHEADVTGHDSAGEDIPADHERADPADQPAA